MDTYTALSDRAALVTGAASGMGAATARALVHSGARVGLLSRRRESLEQLAADLGDRAIALAADVSDPASLAAAHDDFHDAFGPIDLVVNVAGVMLPNPITLRREDEWRRMVETNFYGPLNVVREFLPELTDSGASTGADLVFVSSVAAHAATPEYAVYNSTKAALTHFAATLRTELGPLGIRVSNIEPGLTRTELGRHIDNPNLSQALNGFFDVIPPLEAADVADVIAYLTSRPRHVNLAKTILVPTRQPS